MNVTDIAARIRGEIAKAVVGQEETVTLMLTSLFAGGHILLEGPPGVAKTLLAQSFARTLGLQFGRIQFTPDLMPGDLLGGNLFNFQTGHFALRKGPIFCDLLLADEINRTPPKTQAALLEAMQERHVTLDGVSHPLSGRFMVVATQNPIEHQGAYPLPEAQLDRFLFKQVLTYPTAEEEMAVVMRHGQSIGQPSPEELGVEVVLDRAGLDQAMTAVAAARLATSVAEYIVNIIRATRGSADISVGASPRAGAMLALAARAYAALDGRDYVIPDDVKRLALPALRHRIILSPAAEIDGRQAEETLEGLIATVEAPR